MISYGKQSINSGDIDSVIEVLKSDFLTQGSQVHKFEESLNSYFGSNYASVVSNGTAALHLAGMALGWSKGDVIIVPPITFLSTVNCVEFLNANPYFVDIDPETYTINPNLVEDAVIKLRSKGKNIVAVIGVDFAGHPCDWIALRQIADKYDINLINDNCHAMGAKFEDEKQYASKYADLVTHSYHPVKHITTGEGGAVLTNHYELDQKVKKFRTHGMTKDFHSLEKNKGPWYYEMHTIGYNYRLTDFQCALGVRQLKRLDNFIKLRKKIKNKYNESLKIKVILLFQ